VGAFYIACYGDVSPRVGTSDCHIGGLPTTASVAASMSERCVWPKQTNDPNNAHNLESEFSTLIPVLKKGRSHVFEPFHSFAFPSAGKAREFHVHSPFAKHQETGSAILAEDTL
jgi:hypothetical protein